MKKGTVLIVLPNDTTYRPNLNDIQFPPDCIEYLDGWIHLLYLPNGGSLHIGKKSIEVLGGIHEQIHEILGSNS